jgi:hypothetical protein
MLAKGCSLGNPGDFARTARNCEAGRSVPSLGGTRDPSCFCGAYKWTRDKARQLAQSQIAPVNSVHRLLSPTVRGQYGQRSRGNSYEPRVSSMGSAVPRSRSQKKKSTQALQSVGDELIERCDQYRRTVGCMRPELREAHPAIVGWSTRNRPFFPRPINDRMASRSQRNWVSGVAASPSVRTGSLGTQLA